MGNQYRLDRNYDRYAQLPVFKAIVRRAMLHGLQIETKFSYITRDYSCDVSKLTKFEKSAQWYKIPVTLRHDTTPLGAICAALRDTFIDESELGSPLLLALILEAEVTLLKMAYIDACEREARIFKAINALEDAIRTLQPLTLPISAEPSDVAAAHWENLQAGRIAYIDEDDDL